MFRVFVGAKPTCDEPPRCHETAANFERTERRVGFFYGSTRDKSARLMANSTVNYYRIRYDEAFNGGPQCKLVKTDRATSDRVDQAIDP